MKRLLLPFLITLTPFFLVCGQDSINATDAVEKARELTPQVVEMAEEKVDAVQSKLQGKTKSKVQDPADPATWGPDDVRKLAVLDIKIGKETRTIMFELYSKDAPKTVANFISNVDSGLYKGLAVHRTIDSFLVQMGDPLTADESARNLWGTGGEDSIPAEIKRPHKLGAVAMARRSDKVNPERKSNSSQFYFALGNLSNMDGQYTVFGQVVSGLDELEYISRQPADSNDCPLNRIEIKSITVVDHKGPLVVTRNKGRRITKPFSAKNPFERMLERIW